MILKKAPKVSLRSPAESEAQQPKPRCLPDPHELRLRGKDLSPRWSKRDQAFEQKVLAARLLGTTARSRTTTKIIPSKARARYRYDSASSSARQGACCMAGPGKWRARPRRCAVSLLPVAALDQRPRPRHGPRAIECPYRCVDLTLVRENPRWPALAQTARGITRPANRYTGVEQAKRPRARARVGRAREMSAPLAAFASANDVSLEDARALPW